MHESIFTSDEVSELVSELESALDMMEPYYKQCNADSAARELISRIQAKLPVTISEITPISCKICNETFSLSKKKKVLREIDQISYVHSHLVNVHGILDHTVRKQNIVQAHVVIKSFINQFAYEEYLKVKNIPINHE